MSSPSANAQTRIPLPEGTIPVGIALLIAGVATYAFFKVGTVAVGGAEEFAPIASMWFAVFALAPGFFLPLEQELGRALSHRRAIDDGGRPVVRKVVGLGGFLMAVVTVAILALSPLLATELFEGDWFMLIALIAAFAAYAPAHMARGVCSGSGRFRDYAIVLGSDGIVRILLCIALAVVGVSAAGGYGLAAAGAPQFSYGVLLARIPLFLFQAVQAALLPRLSRQAARGEFDEFRSGLKQLMIVVLGVGVIGTTGAFVLGPWALRIVYDADLSGRTLAMLSLSSAVYMLALATAQAVIALQGHALVAVGWGIGVIGFVLGTWLSSDETFRRIEIGLVVSSLAAFLAFALALRHRLQVGAEPTSGSVIQAITDMPFET